MRPPPPDPGRAQPGATWADWIIVVCGVVTFLAGIVYTIANT